MRNDAFGVGMDYWCAGYRCVGQAVLVKYFEIRQEIETSDAGVGH